MEAGKDVQYHAVEEQNIEMYTIRVVMMIRTVEAQTTDHQEVVTHIHAVVQYMIVTDHMEVVQHHVEQDTNMPL